MALWGKQNAVESRPKHLPDDSNSPHAREKVVATTKGWVMQPGVASAATGNDNPDADPEILVCSRGLRSNGTGDPTANQITIGTTSSKTTYYPDGDAFTGAGSSSANDIVVYLYFNEPVGVRGTPQITLKQATALGSDFSTMDHLSSASNYDAGIVAFGLSTSQPREFNPSHKVSLLDLYILQISSTYSSPLFKASIPAT